MSPAKLQSIPQNGLVHRRAGRLAEAEVLYAQARAMAAKNFDVPHLCGLLARQQNRAAKAILATWRFPATTINASNDHCHPGSNASILASVFNVAAAAADRCGHGWPGEWSCWTPAMEQAEFLPLTEEKLNEATRDALEAFGPVRAAVG